MLIASILVEQIARDTYGPPNRCSQNKATYQCKNAACRNKNGTWSAYCEKHKEMNNRSNHKRRNLYVCQSDEDQDDDDAPVGEGVCAITASPAVTCVECGGPTRPKKRGNGFTIRCDTCCDKNAAHHAALSAYLRAKRDRDAAEEVIDELMAKKARLEQELQQVDQELDDARTYQHEEQEAKKALLLSL